MSHFIPLSQLLATGRKAHHPMGYHHGTALPWAGFVDTVNRYAHALLQRHEQRWLLTTHDSIAFTAQLLALWQTGKIAVLPPNTHTGTLEQLAHAFDAVLDFEPPPQSTTYPFTPLPPSHTAVILYTSGSTGTPKAVPKTLAQLDTELHLLETLFARQVPNAPVIGTAPHHHLYGLTFRILWPLASGRAIDSTSCSHPDMLVERLSQLGRSILVSSPAQLSRWPELMTLSALVHQPYVVFSSGGPLANATHAALLNAFGHSPIEIYGSSETGAIAWRRQDGHHHWTPLPGIAIHTDPSQALLIQSPLLADEQVLRIEDAIELHTDGSFTLKGRLDRTVKIEEKRLFLPDMENQLRSHPAVSNAAIVVLARTRQVLGAVVTLTPLGQSQLATSGKAALSRALRQHLQRHFDAVLMPRHWRFPSQLPFTDRGKLIASDLQELFTHAE